VGNIAMQQADMKAFYTLLYKSQLLGKVALWKMNRGFVGVFVFVMRKGFWFSFKEQIDDYLYVMKVWRLG